MTRLSDTESARLAALGVSREDGEMIRDLSIHAFNEALVAIQRVVGTAPPHLQPSITISAMQGFVSLQKELLETAQKMGINPLKV